MFYEHDCQYEGELEDDKKNDRGKYFFPDDCRFEEEYKDDKRTSQGVMVFAKA